MSRTFFSFALFIFLFILPLSATGSEYEVYTLNEKITVIENENCEQAGTCSLKRARFYVGDSKYRFSSDDSFSFGTFMQAWYETDSIEALEDYVFVQFIRGCMYNSQEKGGRIETYSGFVREFFGDIKVFRHPEWVIDSGGDKDPVYFSFPEKTRHFGYSWTEERHLVDSPEKKFYGLTRPIFPELSVWDYIIDATYLPDKKRATNLSLEFRIGVYRAKDVPQETTPDNISFAKPLIEFKWRSSYVFDHETKSFTHPGDIAPVCNQPLQ